jgi:dTDP-4-amino-4,6-dideoxy-D-galactose acyltransferase
VTDGHERGLVLAEPRCELLEWDSDFFGLRVARCHETHLSVDAVGRVTAWSRVNRVDCLYFLAQSGDCETVPAVEDAGFRLVDVRVELGRAAAAPEPVCAGSSIRPAREGDVPALRGLAAVNHRDSRFYADRHFARGRCDQLYATWIEKSCSGWADLVLVAEGEGRVLGYISCHRRDEEGQIGLLGVAREAQGTGLGARLIAAALSWFAAERLPRVAVVTQGRNTRAIRLYERCGFVTRSQGLWFHYWPGRGESPQ